MKNKHMHIIDTYTYTHMHTLACSTSLNADLIIHATLTFPSIRLVSAACFRPWEQMLKQKMQCHLLPSTVRPSLETMSAPAHSSSARRTRIQVISTCSTSGNILPMCWLRSSSRCGSWCGPILMYVSLCPIRPSASHAFPSQKHSNMSYHEFNLRPEP
jgi:hypothetical protein